MKDYAQVKVSDLKKTHDEECDDVKRVLIEMYPEIFREEWDDITDDVRIVSQP